MKSASLMAVAVPGVISPYGHLNAERAKEGVFEQIRIEHYPKRPSRLNAFFCFPTRKDAEKASTTWFKDEGRLFLELQIVEGSNFFCTDSNLLNAIERDWENAAHRYWSGQVTNDPLYEVVIHGAMYFTGWEQKPFGMFANMRP